MKKNILKAIFASSIGIILLSGCTGSEVVPNNATQGGAIAGAIAGAVIGGNTKGHDKSQRVAIGAAVGAAVGGGIGHVVDGQQPVAQQTGGWQ